MSQSGLALESFRSLSSIAICGLCLAVAGLQSSEALADSPPIAPPALGAPEIPTTSDGAGATKTPTPDPSPDPSPSPTPTPTATPTPTPPPAACSYYTVDQMFVHDGDGYEHGVDMFRAKRGSKVADLYGLTCIQNIFDQCYVPKGTRPKTIGYELLWDDCIFLKLAEIAGLDCGHFTNKQLGCLANGVRCKHTGDPIKGSCRNRQITVNFDRNCQGVKPAPGDKSCGDYDALALWSPISLLWNPEVSIESVHSIVRFKLNPYEHSKWQTWRASAETPLLVFDPLHSGKVESGAQLFGSWTFGGKGYASLDSMLSGAPISEWKDGYEPLSQLDANHNGKVDGAELRPLALWFDRNQDGVSQEGEVLSVEQAGVTALFFSADKYDPRTRATHARLGFERRSAGKLVQGASVDWFSERGDSKFEMVFREQLRSSLELPRLESLEKLAARRAGEKAGAGGDSRSASSELTARFTGPWIWEISDDGAGVGGVVRGGVFFLAEGSSPGEIVGSTYVEIPVRDRAAKDFRSISRLHIKGEVEEHSEKFKFVMRDENNLLTESTAVLSDDGMQLTGQSVTKIVQAKGSKKHSTLKYSWTARRY